MELEDRGVYIAGSARTPIGALGGSLAEVSAVKLGATAIKGALQRSGIDANHVEEAFFGLVVSANCGQAPARQAVLEAGIPNTVPCTQVNKVCASGMKCIMMGANMIRLGDADVVVAGGTESMSNAPHYMTLRNPVKYGHATAIDGLMKDGLTDAINDQIMGIEAEQCAEKYECTRADQDEYAVRSYKRAIEAEEAGHLSKEIVPVSIPQRRGPAKVIEKDEEPARFDEARMSKIGTPFKKVDGTVTAGNASTLADGAAAVILVSGKKAKELKIKPIARVLGYADAAHEAEWFTTAPSKAIPLAMKRANIAEDKVDFYEINEAFSAVCLANQKILKLDDSKLNVWGGAVSLGHPLGCSGARIVVTMLNVLDTLSGKIGVCGVCNGGGGASAMVIENL